MTHTWYNCWRYTSVLCVQITNYSKIKLINSMPRDHKIPFINNLTCTTTKFLYYIFQSAITVFGLLFCLVLILSEISQSLNSSINNLYLYRKKISISTLLNFSTTFISKFSLRICDLFTYEYENNTQTCHMLIKDIYLRLRTTNTISLWVV